MIGQGLRADRPIRHVAKSWIGIHRESSRTGVETQTRWDDSVTLHRIIR